MYDIHGNISVYYHGDNCDICMDNNQPIVVIIYFPVTFTTLVKLWHFTVKLPHNYRLYIVSTLRCYRLTPHNWLFDIKTIIGLYHLIHCFVLIYRANDFRINALTWFECINVFQNRMTQIIEMKITHALKKNRLCEFRGSLERYWIDKWASIPLCPASFRY